MDSLPRAARECLQATDPATKLERTASVAADWRAGRLRLSGADTPPLPAREVAGRPARPQLVPPRQLPRRRLGSSEGRAALLHAVAHIEFNAINLAWDAVYRFPGMPQAYYDDWVGIAADEARHFALVCQRLAAHDCAYGDLDAHDGLWTMACHTEHSCLARMALVPRVLEARGLDVTPAMIIRLREAGDEPSAAALEIILEEEVPHVAAGSRWFAWCCAREGLQPEATFRRLLAEHPGVTPRPPFNRAARRAAGFSEEELRRLEEAS